jgi:Autochaperone Domain Type 1
VLATGGGSIVSAGTAIAFMGGTNQIATFDNFNINNQTGDLIFADPSFATINFNNTVANAGTNNLLNATQGSVVTFNASASTLTGAIQTDSTSTTNVNFTNGTIWTMTGSSTVTNLKVTNSAVVFAPPDSGAGFKTLTVTNYVGSGANITLYAALGGSNSASDRIIINGGSATGSTLLTIKNVGGVGGATTGAGIPIVVAANGGTISSNAFSLASTPVVGAFKYTLDQTNQDWYLVSSPTASVGTITESINTVAKAQQTQIITNRVLTSILLGANEQISCSSCGSGFASIGSFAAGAHGRWGLTDELTLMGGLSYNQWNGSGISVTNAPTVAASLVYDFWKWGPSRPFFEIGGGLTPYEDVSYSRYYPVGFAAGQGNASAIDREVAVFGRAGWVDRFSEVDEAAVYGDLGRNWMQTGGYTEMTSAVNPYPATVANGLDTLNVARLGAQYTRLFNDNIEVNVSGAVAYGFGAGSGAPVNVYGFGPIASGALPNTAWGEYGARIGYRFNDSLVVDAFVIGTAFGEVGTTVHGGIGLRLAF